MFPWFLIQGMQQNKILLCSKQLACSSQTSIVVFSGDSVSKSFQSIQPLLSSPSPSSFLSKTRAQWNQKTQVLKFPGFVNYPVALSVLIQSQCLLLKQEASLLSHAFNLPFFCFQSFAGLRSGRGKPQQKMLIRQAVQRSSCLSGFACFAACLSIHRKSWKLQLPACDKQCMLYSFPGLSQGGSVPKVCLVQCFASEIALSWEEKTVFLPPKPSNIWITKWI